MPSGGILNLRDEIQSYGVPNRSYREFGAAPSSDLLSYLDLFPREDTNSTDLMPDGVAESQGRPLLFVVNESRLAHAPGEEEVRLKALRHKLACRGDRAFLARIRPGEIAVVPVSLEDEPPEWKRYTPETPEAFTFFSRLAQGHYDGEGEPKEADYIFTSMFKLVWSVADRLASLKLKRSDVLSLMGRALFFRFLRDRQVVQDSDVPRIIPNATSIVDCFVNASNASKTCAWLDETFNGDLLPLTDNGSSEFFKEIDQRTGGRVFFHLNAIVRGEEPVGDENYQLPLGIPNFGRYDFAHVPVGLLSQVYERFAWKWDHRTAKETSVHYTPRNIAATLVNEAFDALPDAHKARVLDPACGASVFLVLAFRRLYQARWKVTGKRPDTSVIREILEHQLVGFDISDSAIKLAALSLYLTAIELDPKPVPPEKLKFRHLRDRVLFNFRRKGIDPEEGAVAGSLGEHVGRRFDGHFDLILSNPPWTSLKGKERPLADEFNRLSKEIIVRRSGKSDADGYENPDFGPDLPFVWKATEWCKPNGRIAMALPARILLKQEITPRRARETLFRWLEVTGIVNGTNLSDSDVWPEMSQPFMLFFARNAKPKAGHTLRIVTPQFDKWLNRNAEMRIDSESAQPIEVETAFEQPWIWKALSVGTSLDAQVITRLTKSGFESLSTYWKRLGLRSRQGYFSTESETPSSAKHLKGLPNLTSIEAGEFVVDVTNLPLFQHATLHRTGKLEDYQQPLVIMKQAPGPDRMQAWALLSLKDVVFSRIFHGYSAASHPQGEALCRYIQLFSHTLLRMYFALCTRPRFGAERRVLDKADLDDCPVFPFEKLSATQLQTAAKLSTRLVARDQSVFDEIDAFFADLFGLNAKDMEVVCDTVEVAMPYIESRDRACTPPRASERERFRKRLESILRPFFKVTGDEPQVLLWKSDTALAPFGFLVISKIGTTIAAPGQFVRHALLKLGEETGSTRIIHHIEGGLLIGLLNQYRYWTPSRARLLAAELVREHLDVFE